MHASPPMPPKLSRRHRRFAGQMASEASEVSGSARARRFGRVGAVEPHPCRCKGPRRHSGGALVGPRDSINAPPAAAHESPGQRRRLYGRRHDAVPPGTPERPRSGLARNAVGLFSLAIPPQAGGQPGGSRLAPPRGRPHPIPHAGLRKNAGARPQDYRWCSGSGRRFRAVQVALPQRDQDVNAWVYHGLLQ